MSHVDEGTLHALVDNELAPAERAAVEAHLATCGECARSFAEATAMARQVRTLLGALDESPAMPVRIKPAPTPVRAAALASVNVSPMQRRMRALRRVALAASVLLVAGISYRVGVNRQADAGARVSAVAETPSRPAPRRAMPSVVEAAPEAIAMPSAPTVRVAPRGGPRAEQEVGAAAVAAPLAARVPMSVPAPSPVPASAPIVAAAPPVVREERKSIPEEQTTRVAEAADRAAQPAAPRRASVEASVAVGRRAAPVGAAAASADAERTVSAAANGMASPAAPKRAVSALTGYQAVEDVALPSVTRRRYVAVDGTTLVLMISPVVGEATKPTASKAAPEFTVSSSKGRSTVRWQLDGQSYELQGALAPDSLVKLATQLK